MSLLLTLNLFSKFCWSSWMPLEEGGWALLFSLPMVLKGWGPGLGFNIQFPSGPQWAARLKSFTQLHTVWVNLDMLFHLATQPLGMHSSNHCWGEPTAARDFLTKQLPVNGVLNEHTVFHIAQLSNQSRDYPSQGPTRPTPPFSKRHLASQFLWCRCLRSQWVCTASVCLPLHLCSSQQLPASRSLLVPGHPPCSGMGGSWCSNSPPRILWQALGQGPQQPWSPCSSQGSYCLSTVSSPSVFQYPP